MNKDMVCFISVLMLLAADLPMTGGQEAQNSSAIDQNVTQNATQNNTQNLTQNLSEKILRPGLENTNAPTTFGLSANKSKNGSLAAFEVSQRLGSVGRINYKTGISKSLYNVSEYSSTKSTYDIEKYSADKALMGIGRGGTAQGN